MLKAIKKRRSIRKFQTKPVEEERLKEILKAAMFAPSGHNERPWNFVVVRDKGTKQKLAESQRWASFVEEAAAIIVVVSGQENWLWVENCTLAAGNIYLEATNHGLGACWVQIRGAKTVHDQDSEEFVRKVLGIPADRRVLCLMALGYPAEQKEEHHDSEFDSSKIHKEVW
jgi:nitroreductase